MNESQVYEMIGRKQAAFEQLDAEYTKLLNLLSRVKAGEVLPCELAIDSVARSWAVVPMTVPMPEAIRERMNGDGVAHG